MSQIDRQVRALMDLYPRIYFACHERHRRIPGSGRTLTTRQAGILDHLDREDPRGLTQLAEHMGVTPGTMSLAVDRLVRAGYVRRERDPVDARRVRLRLTAAGTRMKRAGSVLEPGRVKALLRRVDPGMRSAALQGLWVLAKAADEEMQARSREGSWAGRGRVGGGSSRRRRGW